MNSGRPKTRSRPHEKILPREQSSEVLFQVPSTHCLPVRSRSRGVNLAGGVLGAREYELGIGRSQRCSAYYNDRPGSPGTLGLPRAGIVRSKVALRVR